MSKQSAKSVSLTIGLDVGDRTCVAVALDAEGEVLEEIKLATTPKGIETAFGRRAATRVALEVGTHSAWISEQLASLGHEVIVANSRKVALISQGIRKSDRVDAEALARLARLDATCRQRPARGRHAPAVPAMLGRRFALRATA